MYDIRMKQIECFLEAAELLNLTAAAKKLYISQPLATKWIKSLEEELDVVLFERKKTGLKLTQEGCYLKEKWKPLYREWHRTIEEMHLLGESVEGILKVGCLEYYEQSGTIRELISDFEKKNPQVELELSAYGLRDLIDHLMEGHLDVAFHTTIDLKNNEDVKWCPISEIHFCIAVSKTHPLAAKSELTLSDLKDETFFGLSSVETPAGIQQIRRVCHQAGFEPKKIIEVPNISSLALSLIYQNGVTVMTKENMLAFTNQIKLVDIDIKPREYMALIWRAKNPGMLAKRFAECTTNYMLRHEL